MFKSHMSYTCIILWNLIYIQEVYMWLRCKKPLWFTHCIIQHLIDTVEDVLSHTSCKYLNNSLLIENWPDLHVSVIDLGGKRQNNESVPALYIFPLHSISPNEPPSPSSVSYSLSFLSIFHYLSVPQMTPW